MRVELANSHAVKVTTKLMIWNVLNVMKDVLSVSSKIALILYRRRAVQLFVLFASMHTI